MAVESEGYTVFPASNGVRRSVFVMPPLSDTLTEVCLGVSEHLEDDVTKKHRAFTEFVLESYIGDEDLLGHTRGIADRILAAGGKLAGVSLEIVQYREEVFTEAEA